MRSNEENSPEWKEKERRRAKESSARASQNPSPKRERVSRASGLPREQRRYSISELEKEQQHHSLGYSGGNKKLEERQRQKARSPHSSPSIVSDPRKPIGKLTPPRSHNHGRQQQHQRRQQKQRVVTDQELGQEHEQEHEQFLTLNQMEEDMITKLRSRPRLNNRSVRVGVDDGETDNTPNHDINPGPSQPLADQRAQNKIHDVESDGSKRSLFQSLRQQSQRIQAIATRGATTTKKHSRNNDDSNSTGSQGVPDQIRNLESDVVSKSLIQTMRQQSQRIRQQLESGEDIIDTGVSPIATELQRVLSVRREDPIPDSVGDYDTDEDYEANIGPAPIPPPPNSRRQGEQYPATDIGQYDIPTDDAGGIQAFVADNVVDATGVAIVMSEEEEDKLQQNRFVQVALCICIFLLALAISVTVPIVTTNNAGRNAAAMGTRSPTSSPSMAPSTTPTSSPTSALFDATIQLIIDKNISTSGSLFNTGTPQNEALNWITMEDKLQRSIDDPRYIQRYIAAVWYFSTAGDNWFDCSRKIARCQREPFLSNTDECEWDGVTCIANRIDKFFFGTVRGQNLVGTIPDELCHLPELSQFFLQNNQLSGTVPPCIGDVLTLRQFVVTNNLLESPLPKSLFDKPLMIQVSLEVNRFQEEFPDLSKMPQLTDFRAHSNNFTGSIPPGIEKLTKLTTFEVQKNELTGTFPKAFADFPNLEFLLLHENKFHGTFPTRIFNHRNLRRLMVSNNSFVGTIPSFVENLGRKSTRRKELWLHGNNFSGSIPSELGNIEDLHEVKLAGNNFVGKVPKSLCSIRGDLYNDLNILEVDCGKVDCSCCSNC